MNELKAVLEARIKRNQQVYDAFIKRLAEAGYFD